MENPKQGARPPPGQSSTAFGKHMPFDFLRSKTRIEIRAATHPVLQQSRRYRVEHCILDIPAHQENCHATSDSLRCSSQLDHRRKRWSRLSIHPKYSEPYLSCRPPARNLDLAAQNINADIPSFSPYKLKGLRRANQMFVSHIHINRALTLNGSASHPSPAPSHAPLHLLPPAQ